MQLHMHDAISYPHPQARARYRNWGGWKWRGGQRRGPGEAKGSRNKQEGTRDREATRAPRTPRITGTRRMTRSPANTVDAANARLHRAQRTGEPTTIASKAGRDKARECSFDSHRGVSLLVIIHLSNRSAITIRPSLFVCIARQLGTRVTSLAYQRSNRLFASKCSGPITEILR